MMFVTAILFGSITLGSGSLIQVFTERRADNVFVGVVILYSKSVMAQVTIQSFLH